MGKKDTVPVIEVLKTPNYSWLKLKNKPGVLIIAIVALLAIGIFSIPSVRINLGITKERCSDRLLTGISSDLQPVNPKVLQGDITKIIAIRGHTSDLNCMYALTRLYIATGDGSNARTALGTLKNDLKTKKQLSAIIAGPRHPTVADLQDTVDFMVKPQARSQHLIFDTPGDK